MKIGITRVEFNGNKPMIIKVKNKTIRMMIKEMYDVDVSNISISTEILPELNMYIENIDHFHDIYYTIKDIDILSCYKCYTIDMNDVITNIILQGNYDIIFDFGIFNGMNKQELIGLDKTEELTKEDNPINYMIDKVANKRKQYKEDLSRTNIIHGLKNELSSIKEVITKVNIYSLDEALRLYKQGKVINGNITIVQNRNRGCIITDHNMLKCIYSIKDNIIDNTSLTENGNIYAIRIEGTIETLINSIKKLKSKVLSFELYYRVIVHERPYYNKQKDKPELTLDRQICHDISCAIVDTIYKNEDNDKYIDNELIKQCTQFNNALLSKTKICINKNIVGLIFIKAYDNFIITHDNYNYKFDTSHIHVLNCMHGVIYYKDNVLCSVDHLQANGCYDIVIV